LIVALAGRRIDGPEAARPAFPQTNTARVAARLEETLRARGARALVCAAACGVDLLALEVAARLGIRRRVVLAGERDAFRAGSVVDRGAEWGPRFDRAVDEAGRAGDLVIVRDLPAGDEGYLAANQAILDEALGIAQPRGPESAGLDITAAFAQAARSRGMEVLELSTLAP
jgi:hypothetical protein